MTELPHKLQLGDRVRTHDGVAHGVVTKMGAPIAGRIEWAWVKVRWDDGFIGTISSNRLRWIPNGLDKFVLLCQDSN